MSTISERIQEALKIRKMKQADLVAKTGIGKSSISTYISGEYEPKQKNIYKIAEALRVNEAWLMGYNVPMDRYEQGSPVGTLSLVPIVGKISCGNGLLAYEEIEGYEATPKEWLNGGDYFYLRAKGDSMTGARIYDGDLLLIRKQPEVENGEIAAVIIGDDSEAVLKRVYKSNGQIVLQPENSSYGPIFCPPNKAKIVGRLKKIVINL